VLAYLFWHQPQDPAAIEPYEEAQRGFHRSLKRRPPVGLCGSAVFRVADLPWLARAPGADRSKIGQQDAAPAGVAYEDWYLIEDHAALGVLGEAAVGRGHRTAHDEVARRSGAGAAGLYGLLEGDRAELAKDAGVLARASLAIWIARRPGCPRGGAPGQARELGELLGDGMDPRRASLWQRQLVLGPAPEFCLLAPEAPPGVAPTRLPAGWTESIFPREVLWSG
jgi:hypothetical protein